MAILPPAQPELEISIATQGMSKGISQTSGPQAVVRGALSWGDFYVAMLAKNFSAEHADAELQYSIGGAFASGGTSFAGTVTYKRGITSIGNSDDQSIELGIAASHAFGKLVPRAQVIFSPNDLGQARASLYAELGAGWTLGPRWEIEGSFGHRARGNHVDYSFANLGISYSLNRRLVAEIQAYATNQGDEGERYKPRMVAVLRARF